jgi:hypothetical protein
VTLTKISTDWQTFKGHLDRIHPRFNEPIPIGYDHDDEQSGL